MGSKESLSRLDQAEGEIVRLQLIRFEAVPVDFPQKYFDWVFFGSRRGVRFFLDMVPEETLEGVNIGCVGEKTADAVRQKGMEIAFVPSRYSSTYWPKEFVEQFPDARGILFPTSNLSTFQPPGAFKEKGIYFHKLVVYRTLCADVGLPERAFQGVVFASPSCFNCFVEKWGLDVLREKVLVAIGDVTGKSISDAGLSCSIPDRFTMADAICHCRKLLESS